MKFVVLKSHKNMDEENYKKINLVLLLKVKISPWGMVFMKKKIEVWIDKNEVIDKIESQS